MNNYKFLLVLTLLAMLLLGYYAQQVMANDEVVKRTSPTESEQESFERSIQQMLGRAQLTRTLAAEHLVFLRSNSDKGTVYQIDEASQVMAYNLICQSEEMSAKRLNHIAADTSYQIAMFAGQSPISETLSRIGADLPVSNRMELLGDIATTVLMFEVGRRRGLYDALLIDYGEEKFCSALKGDIVNRYNSLVAGLGM